MAHPSTVCTIVTDERHRMRFHLMAERPLSLPEAVQAIHTYMDSRPRWVPRPGTDVTIETMIGDASPAPPRR